MFNLRVFLFSFLLVSFLSTSIYANEFLDDFEYYKEEESDDDVMDSLRNSISNEFDRKLFHIIEKTEMGEEIDEEVNFVPISFLSILNEFNIDKDKYSKSFFNNITNFLDNVLYVVFGCAIANCEPFDDIKIIIDSWRHLDPEIARVLYWKSESESVFEMDLFSLFVSKVSRHTFFIYEWENKIVELWKNNKSYLVKIFNYIYSTDLYRNEDLSRFV